MKTVSIIIPIYNSEKYLPALFSCLNQCEYIDGDEILLIDNGSTDSTGALCKQQAEICNRYKYFYFDEKADSYAARNFGIKNSSGDVLVFTDADCKPTEEWLSSIRENIEDGIFIAGSIILEITENTVWECFDSVTHLSQTKNNISAGCVATANMSVMKKDLLDRVGLFEERFAGGDFEWSKRAVKSGLKLLYLEKALVYHPSRKTFNEISTREKRSAYGAGKQCGIKKGSLLKLRIIYFLKILKVDTYLQLVRQIRKKGISRGETLRFLLEFIYIRIQQLGAAVAGYKGKNPRELGIK